MEGFHEPEYILNDKCQHTVKVLQNTYLAPILDCQDFSQEFMLDTKASVNTTGAVLYIIEVIEK